jgi:hypothetical protein
VRAFSAPCACGGIAHPLHHDLVPSAMPPDTPVALSRTAEASSRQIGAQAERPRSCTPRHRRGSAERRPPVLMQSRSRANRSTFICTPDCLGRAPFICWRNGVRGRLSER